MQRYGGRRQWIVPVSAQFGFHCDMPLRDLRTRKGVLITSRLRAANKLASGTKACSRRVILRGSVNTAVSLDQVPDNVGLIETKASGPFHESQRYVRHRDHYECLASIHYEHELLGENQTLQGPGVVL